MDQNVAAFNKRSLEYEFARPVYPKEVFDFLSNRCPNKKRAWDCACGTGQVSKSLINYFSKISATDINENQIKSTTKHKTIEFSVQKSESTNFPSEYFDLICVAQALHWFDINDYFQEVNRLLKQDGIFACLGYGFFKIEDEIDIIIKKTILKPLNSYWSKKILFYGINTKM